jgi:hypothetical protein
MFKINIFDSKYRIFSEGWENVGDKPMLRYTIPFKRVQKINKKLRKIV